MGSPQEDGIHGTSPITPQHLEMLQAIERRVLWLSTYMIHHANKIRPNPDGLKVGGHQASSSSVVSLATALYFHFLRPQDHVAFRACLRRYHASQATDHQVDHGDADHGLTGVG
jgi:pyruvate dehydrogenase complex dehydrogenase (E1) component